MRNTIWITPTILRHTVFYPNLNDYQTRTNGSSRNHTLPSHSSQRYIFLYIHYLRIPLVSTQELPHPYTRMERYQEIRRRMEFSSHLVTSRRKITGNRLLHLCSPP